MRSALPQELFDNTRLLISELVANAVEHVEEDGDIEVRLALGDGVLRVEVIDPGPGFEYVPRAAAASAERGWGLHFVNRLAARWDIDHDQSTRVWFELTVP